MQKKKKKSKIQRHRTYKKYLQSKTQGRQKICALRYLGRTKVSKTHLYAGVIYVIINMGCQCDPPISPPPPPPNFSTPSTPPSTHTHTHIHSAEGRSIPGAELFITTHLHV